MRGSLHCGAKSAPPVEMTRLGVDGNLEDDGWVEFAGERFGGFAPFEA